MTLDGVRQSEIVLDETLQCYAAGLIFFLRIEIPRAIFARPSSESYSFSSKRMLPHLFVQCRWGTGSGFPNWRPDVDDSLRGVALFAVGQHTSPLSFGVARHGMG